MAKAYSTLRARLTPEQRNKSAGLADGMMAEMVLQELRESLQLTQEEVSRALRISQPSFSKMESQDDMYISTLRRVVQALGGELQLVAKFPDRTVVIRNPKGG